MVRLQLVVILLVVIICGCVPVDVPELECQTTLGEFAALTQDLEIPLHLQYENAQKNGSEFDVNQYFTVLTHLSAEDGYVLDYVYFNDGFASWPVIYSRRSEVAPYSTHSEYESDTELDEYHYKHMDHIAADGSPAGYLEWVLLAMSNAE